ncbi:MAG: methyltransferase [Deltaproteobacteria bacterium]|nr:methyltransferase [Deltaproteobacteria bacterium]
MDRTPEELLALVRSSGFTPSARDLPALFDLVAAADRDVARMAIRSLARLGALALPEAMTRFDDAVPPLRARLCDLVAVLGEDLRDVTVGPWLLARLGDADGVTRRRAALQLGKRVTAWPHERDLAEAALTQAFATTTDLADRRALAEALGRLGSGQALKALDAQPPAAAQDALLEQRLTQARLRIEQRELRRVASTITLDAPLGQPTAILLHVRSGLEGMLLDELQAVPGLLTVPREVGAGRVRVMTTGTLRPLFAARTFMHLGFPIEFDSDPHDVVGSVVDALVMPSTQALFRSLTDGPVRFRINWAGGGQRRSDTRAVAERVVQAVPWLINDSTQAPWEVVVSEVVGKTGPRVFVELWPQKLVDPRFAYRKATMPASSHPTIAAALVRVAGCRAGDVVWDPFVGTGMELAERSLAGPYKQLFGTDVDPQAIAAAQENVASAKAQRVTLTLQDARTFAPPLPLSLVITNPPFGRRVAVSEGVRELLEDVLGHAAALLGPQGRMAFITPRVHATEAVMLRAGLVRQQQLPVDVGGFSAHLELWQRR